MGKKVLFITNRNIINTCGELRLIKNRAESLFKSLGITTDFVAFTSKKQTHTENIEAGGTLRVYHFSQFDLANRALVFNRMKTELLQILREENYYYVILSGALMLPLLVPLKSVRDDVVFIADCHGAFEELIEFSAKSKVKTILRHLLYHICKQNETRYLKQFDYILAVSETLKEYLVKNYSIPGSRIHVVPCAIEHITIKREKLMRSRVQARKRYGVEDDELFFLYSGGTSKWQCIEETVDIYRRIEKEIGRKCKLLLLSGDREYISKFAAPGIICDSLRADQVAATLPAGDFAFLIRDCYVTNEVAYPNKYIEYISAGLKVISTRYLKDIANSIETWKLGYVLQDIRYEGGLCAYLKNADGFGSDFEQRQLLIDDVCFESRLRFFKEL